MPSRFEKAGRGWSVGPHCPPHGAPRFSPRHSPQAPTVSPVWGGLVARLPWWPRPSSPARRRPGGWQLWCWVLGAGCTGLVLRQGWAHCGVNGGTGCCAHGHKSAWTSSESASSLRSNQHGCVDVEAGTGGPRDIPYGAGGQPGPEWLLWPTRTDQVQTLGDEHGMVAVAGGRGQRTGTLGCAPSPPPPGGAR